MLFCVFFLVCFFVCVFFFFFFFLIVQVFHPRLITSVTRDISKFEKFIKLGCISLTNR